MPAYFWQTKLEEVAIARAQVTVVNLELMGLGKLIAQQGRDFVKKVTLRLLSDFLLREKLTHTQKKLSNLQNFIS